MKATRIDHIAVVVKDLEAAVATYQHNFDLEKAGGGEVPSLGIHNAFLQIGGARIELMTPTSATGPVAEFLEQRGEGMYLLSLEVEDLDEAVAHLQDTGVRVRVAEGSTGQRLAFVSPKSTHGVLLQLLERQDASDA
jgi:methylmalonyl-CoA/ethylmalonyl-CoA epimerase